MKLKVRSTEFYLLLIVSLISVSANLPSNFIGQFIDQRLLLIVLCAVVVIALLRYLQLLLFLCVTALAIGANLPERLSKELGVSTDVMLIFLAIIILIALLNRFIMRLPTGKPEFQAPKMDNAETRKAILIAISTGNVNRLRWLIKHNMEINFSENGVSPAVVAAETGNSEIMQLLVYHGVYLVVLSPEGKTPLQIAEARGFTRTAEIIRVAMDNRMASSSQQPAFPDLPDSTLTDDGLPASAAAGSARVWSA